MLTIGLEDFYQSFIDEGFGKLDKFYEITDEELKNEIELNEEQIEIFTNELRRLKKQGLGRLAKFKIYKGKGDLYMWPPKDWTEDEILKEIQKVEGEPCDPKNNINCPNDEVCNLSEDPTKCISPRFAGKIKEFKKLEEMEFEGKRIIGSESMIRILKDELNIKEEGTPIVEKIKPFLSEDEEITEAVEEEPVPLSYEEKIGSENIKDTLEQIETVKEEDINNINFTKAQNLMLECLGLQG